VFTFEPEGWPLGVITGFTFVGGSRGRVFHIEHVIVLPGAPPSTLLGTLSMGLRAAHDLKYDGLRVFLHDQHPLAAQLLSLVSRYRFAYDGPADDGEYYYKEIPR